MKHISQAIFAALGISLLASLLALVSLTSVSSAHAAAHFGAPLQADQDEDLPIAAIQIRGNQRVEQAAIRHCIKLKRGGQLDRAVIRLDVRRIYGLGRFRDVQVEARQRKGGLVVIYHVKERPMVRRVKLSGHKQISRDDLRKLLDIKEFAILDRVKVKTNADKLLAHYHKEGFHFARVSPKITPRRRGVVDVTFRIREGSKLRIHKINLLGNRQIKSDTLKRLLYSQETNLLTLITGSSIYRRSVAERDAYLLHAYYMDQGYIQVRIKKPLVQYNRRRKSIALTYQIHEGRRYQYGHIDVKGDLLWPKEQLLRRLTIRTGQFFHHTRLYKENILRLQTMYQDRGYAYVNVVPRHQIHKKSQRVDLALTIHKGMQIRVERIEIIGNTTTRDQVIRRHIRIKEGDIYHGSLVEQSQRRVYALGYFARTHPRYGVKVVSRQGSSPDRMILRFVVKEKPSGNIRLGLGYGQINGLMLTGGFSKQNVFGWGKSVSLGLELSLVAQQVQLQYIDPHFLGTQLSLGVSFYHTMNQASPFQGISFGEMRTGGSLTLGYPIVDRLRAFLSYRVERIGRNPLVGSPTETTLLARTLFGRDGVTLISSLRAGFQLDRRNNRINPTSGTFHSISLEVSDSFLGSQSPYIQFSLINRGYVELPLGLLFKVNTEIGFLASPGDKEVPYFTRYRMGGATTIRGYGDLSIGPEKTIALGIVDSARLNWGGTKKLLLNVELEIPIVPKIGLKAVAFFDAGNVYADNEMFFQDLRNPGLPFGLLMSAGFGLRWQSPIGLLRFEFGFPLVRRAQDQSWRFHFSIGHSF